MNVSPRHASLALALALGLAGLSGCSSIPEGVETIPERLPGAPEQLPLALALGEVEIALAESEKPKGYLPSEVLDQKDARKLLEGWASAAGAFRKVRATQGSSLEEQLEDAWRGREDLLLQVTLGDFRTDFDGHTGWWIPNMVNWFMFMAPAWFVATEDYSLAFDALFEVRSVDSNAVLYRGEREVKVTGTFDDFDRGWQFFGAIYPDNDADNWRQIARALLPAAQKELGQAAVDELRGPLYEVLARETTQDQMSKTLAVVVGVSFYEDALQLPPLPYAADDAKALAQALIRPEDGLEAGLPERAVFQLVGADATQKRLKQVLAEVAERSQPQDQVLFYFAGYGTRSDQGRAQLVLPGQVGGGAERLELSELGELLAKIRGSKLSLLDCAFDGQPRSIKSQAKPPQQAEADAEALAQASGGGVVLACAPASQLVTSEHLEAGLFGYHLVQGLLGSADRDEDRRVSHEELFRYAYANSVRESGWQSARPQRPLAVGLDQAPFFLQLPLASQK